MRYIVIHQVKNGDCFTYEHETVEKAVSDCKNQLNYLSNHDRKHTDFLVVLDSVNPDTDAVDHLDGSVVFSAL